MQHTSLAIPAILLLAACSAAPMKTEVRSSSSRLVPEALDPIELNAPKGVWEGAPLTAEELAEEDRAAAAATASEDSQPVTAVPIEASAPTAQKAKAPAAGPTASEIAQANNPLANFTALNFHNYYVPDLTDLPDQSMNNFWLRYAKPVDSWLIRASLPVNNIDTSPNSSESGLGDLNAFAAYILSDETSPVTYGVGPMMTIPTASDDALGSGKWQIGAAAVYFNAESHEFQYGGLLTYQIDFAGEGDRSDVSFLTMQPFAFYQLGGGSYLRSVGIWAFNTENGNYNVPIGAGYGKVFKLKNGNVLNAFIEPQFTVLSDGPGQPGFQVFFGLNTQFM